MTKPLSCVHSKMFLKLYAIALFILLLPASLRAEDFHQLYTPVSPPETLPDILIDDGKGPSKNLTEFQGHAVLLNLWATWCGPCIAEMPSLDALQAKIGESNLTVIALDQERDSADVTSLFFKRHEIKDLHIYTDPSGHSAAALHARGLPVTYLINADGKMIGHFDGAVDWSMPEVEKFLRQQLIKSK